MIPFLTPGKPQRLLGKLLSFFVFVFLVFFLFFCFFYKGKTAFFEKRGSAVRNTPVGRGTITANPGLNFNSSFFFFYSKAFSRIIFLLFLGIQSSDSRQTELN